MRRDLTAIVVVVLLGACGGDPQRPPAAGAPDTGAQAQTAPAGEELPSWRDGAARRAILDFTQRVTTEGAPGFVPPGQRIAVFDNDGTLWGEQPLYVQGVFAIDRIKALAPSHPGWRTTQPFKGVLEGDAKAVAAMGEQGLAEILAASHAHTTTEEFEAIVRDWIGRARHPTTGRLYTDMVYQPMRELLDHLRSKGFITYIVSGGGVEFMRPWVEETYGIPPQQVVGSRIKVKYEVRNGIPILARLPAVDLVNDGEGKPVGIHQVIGRRPIAAFGNSDGDFQMLEWTTSGRGARLGLLVHHTDADREFAYDRASHVGRLARGLDEAAARGWVVVDMGRDWHAVYPPTR